MNFSITYCAIGQRIYETGTACVRNGLMRIYSYLIFSIFIKNEIFIKISVCKSQSSTRSSGNLQKKHIPVSDYTFSAGGYLFRK